MESLGRRQRLHGLVTESRRQPLLANDRNSQGSGVVGKFLDRIHRSLVPSVPPGFFRSGPTFAMGTAGWTRLGARGRAVKMDRIRANVVGASANKIGWLPIRSSARREASAPRSRSDAHSTPAETPA